jgi:anti-anti-sigma factor
VQINERQWDDVCVIALTMSPQMRGRYEALQTRVRERTAAGVNKFIFELSACEWIDSAALGEFIKAQVHVMRQGGQLRLAAVPPKIQALLEVTNLSQVFVICADETIALASFQ